mmetsp:Transcript_7065/g.11218  ORF Transcript_7065/g.11218 Transcript_7065/m.11218 type:complete len:188 (-) Transcript_7065:759-1322(-)|eukprot:CAMPEP_0203744376 /NCGR_PEP_ID=MMETSP0098-20131031/466_1 /ASSEMBLY_ACC=CAM_ASM_000208 /TAXON_ID=96639 /ORGANISM=" , Strain NY0313808BC1" /LENGTH=187 /DNA_ID=CAMNT_0050631881 /DNA_START=723 /DNA_END=1286 /DNA_ORIENTATION=+
MSSSVRVPWENGEGRRGVSLEAFAGAKQHDPYFSKMRKKMERGRRAKLVMGYKKVLRKEGVDDFEELDAKIGKKRHRDETSTEEDGKQQSDDKKSTKRPKNRNGFEERESKPDRYKSAKELAKKRQDAKQNREKEREEQAKLIKKKQKERRNTTRKLRKKTKKGQPILKHTIDHLLNKIIKDQKTQV